MFDGIHHVTQACLRELVLAKQLIQGALRRIAGELLHEIALQIHHQRRRRRHHDVVGAEQGHQYQQHYDGDHHIDHQPAEEIPDMPGAAENMHEEVLVAHVDS